MRNFTRLLALVIIPLLASVSPVGAQQKARYNVAIFLYDRVELLDFSGPGEVFGATDGFRTYTVSADGSDLTAQGFVHIKPQYSIANAPAPDIIVFPGGDSGPSSNDPRVIAWVKERAGSGTLLMSVCTGAGILAKAGMLENLNVTTFHGAIPYLQAQLPNSKVLEHTRYVDNGYVITTAGVSAGIDGALHLLSRIKGEDVAKATAFYMEYDKWKPREGRLDYKNPIIEQLKKEGANPEREINSVMSIKTRSKEIPFEGELKNLAFDLRDQGKYEQAIKVLEATIKLYPNSGHSYNELGLLNRKIGRPAPIDAASFLKLIESGKVDEAVTIFEQDHKKFPSWKIFNEGEINMAGYHLLTKNDYANAIKVFQLNTKAYPESANAFDSLGEAYMKAGDKKEAVASYWRSLKMDPANENAKQMLVSLGEKI